MVGLLILKQLRNLSDERVVKEWTENPYYQYFCGEVYFKWEFPCDPTDLVYFRRRIGKEGIKKILEVSIKLHGKKAREKEVLIDTRFRKKTSPFLQTQTQKDSREMCQDSQRGRDKRKADIQKDDNQTDEGTKIQESSQELPKGQEECQEA